MSSQRPISSSLSSLSLVASLVLAVGLAGCTIDKQDDKGVVDDSLPPAIPTDPAGKADDAARVVALALSSAHPYRNNFDRTWSADLGALPSCAQRARLHFSVLRTEADYDYVEVAGPDGAAQSFDGNHDDTWSEWFNLDETRRLSVRLTTDSSITRHGFDVDAAEWAPTVMHCPLLPIHACPEGTVTVQAPTPECACPAAPLCLSVGNVEISHATRRGWNFHGKQTIGTRASTLGTGPADGVEATEVGTVTAAGVEDLVHQLATSGLLFGDAYDRIAEAGQFVESFTVKAGSFDLAFYAPQGGHSAEVAAAIATFEALFTCGADTGGLTCDPGRVCQDGACVIEETCVCPENYDPVCAVGFRTFSNACTAACAGVEIFHEGACGQPGDMCGGLMGLTCVDDLRCRFGLSAFEYPFPDAAGTCVARDYCDAPTDCNHLPHIAVPGAWACEENACRFHAGPPWRAFAGGRFETAHPYANSTSVWKQVFLPAEAQALRLSAVGVFDLEQGYDYLEVWSWIGGRWVNSARYTGRATPPAATEFPGRYFYLRFVSDSSVVAEGFNVLPEWR